MNTLNMLNVVFVFILVDPPVCKYIRWKIITPNKIKGNKKWAKKNKCNVYEDNLYPNQIQDTRMSPIIGITESIPVITVAPQNLICPQGKTYPKKATPISIKYNSIPETQV